jgi:mono/diheme cytochrome c family protein
LTLKMMGALCPLLFIQFLCAQTPDLDKGRRLYLSNCISCHNRDPNISGSIGPEVIDAPLEVMKHKIMTGTYPAVLPKGFRPKRKTKLMRKIPKLEKEIPLIYDWIQSVNEKKKP